MRVSKWKNATWREAKGSFNFYLSEMKSLKKSKKRFKRRFLNDSGERRYQHVQTMSMISANKKNCSLEGDQITRNLMIF